MKRIYVPLLTWRPIHTVHRVRLVLQTLMRSTGDDALLVPFPQYPIYTALAALFNVKVYGYYLDESQEWSLTVAELERAAAEARAEGKVVKAIAVISPGNPTGQVLSYANMAEIVKFCAREGVVLLADEVYQINIYQAGLGFVSFKKVAMDLLNDPAHGGLIADGLELASFHTASKGVSGECGIRGGYFELFGFDPAIKAQMLKLASITLCPNTPGQIATAIMVNPPRDDSPSAVAHSAQVNETLASLGRRGAKIAAALNTLEGVTCNPPAGAMYAFPQVRLPAAAIAAAEAADVQPDVFYCMELLKATGIVTAAGSGFGQRDGTWHFRTTFLPPEHQVDTFTAKLADFHNGFIQRFGGGVSTGEL